MKKIRSLKLPPILKNNSGQGLISVMVGLALTGVIMLVMMQLSSDQSIALKAFTQKSDTILLRNFVAQQLSFSNICDWQFASNSSAVINTNSPSATNDINFDRLYTGIDTSSKPMVSRSGEASEFSGLKVESIKFKNITGAGAQYTGQMVITFDKNTSARSKMIMKPLTIDLAVNVNTAAGIPTARPIVACGTSNSGSGSPLMDIVYNVNHYSINLPVGNSYDLLLTTTFFTCEDSVINMNFDGTFIPNATYKGANTNSQGCDQNTLMAKLSNVSGGIHNVTFNGPEVAQVTHWAIVLVAGLEQWQHQWIAFKK